MIVSDCIQGSEQWHNERIGIPTSSNFSKIITPTGQFSKQSVVYQDELLAEYIVNKYEPSYISEDMERGILRESEARKFYEYINEVKVEEVGLVYLNEDKKISCSPDGLINREKGLEIKCPKLSIQIKRFREGIVPKEYYAQIQGSMWITGYKEWDFLSYNPQFKPFLITVPRDQFFIDKLSEAVLKFSNELETQKAELDAWKEGVF